MNRNKDRDEEIPWVWRIQLLNWRNRHAQGIFYWMEETDEKPERIYF